MAKENLSRQSRVAFYARVSTLNHNQDPEMQLRELRQYAMARGWDVAGEYVDRGIRVDRSLIQPCVSSLPRAGTPARHSIARQGAPVQAGCRRVRL